MQTFLPYPDFARSTACLDRQRLGKQRLECLQILHALRGETTGWRCYPAVKQCHPAVKMWLGHSGSLSRYGAAVCAEWIRRGYHDTLAVQFETVQSAISDSPSWLGDDRLHASHRSNLLRKLPEHYGLLGWTEPPDMPYWWPS